LRRVPPVLAVEIAGVDDTVDGLRDKAAWYLKHGVEVVWLLLARSRTAAVITNEGERTVARTDRMPLDASLPDLAPVVGDLFRQLDV
jgi:hypothetical protein